LLSVAAWIWGINYQKNSPSFKYSETKRVVGTGTFKLAAVSMKISHVEIGICGLSCRLCPAYHRETKSRCGGCKSQYRMGAPCPFHNCAIKKKGVEFCWLCGTSDVCEKWRKHRELGKQHDSIKCYQTLEKDIASIRKSGIEEFEDTQKRREKLLRVMLLEFNEGRSKTLYSIAATVFEIEELERTIDEAREKTKDLKLKEKSEILHQKLNEVAEKKNYLLKLRK
jgi:hypothetical protein